MLNLFTVKPKTENPDAKPEVKISAAELRLQKGRSPFGAIDARSRGSVLARWHRPIPHHTVLYSPGHCFSDMQELSLGSNTSISFPEGKDNLLAFDITLKPEEGFWKGGAFNFTFRVTSEYPHKPPKVHCETKVRAKNTPTVARSQCARGALQSSCEPPLDSLEPSAARM